MCKVFAACAQSYIQVPYHDGAVKFYKEAGLWTDAAEATQAALLK